MKHSKLMLCTIAMILLFCGSIYSQPTPGSYDSRNEDFEAGTWSEILYGGSEGAPGNEITAGAEFYYKFEGALLDNVVELGVPDKDVPRSYYEYRTVYKGGHLILYNYDKAGWFNVKDSSLGSLDLAYEVKLQNTIVITKKYVDLDGKPTGEIEFALIVVDAGFVDYPGYTASVTAKFEKGTPIPMADPLGYGGVLSWAIITIQAPPIIHVPVDIKPGSCPNPVNVKSNGVLPVAVLGTADFDVRDINPATIKLNGVSPLRWSFENVSTPEPFEEDGDAYSCNQKGPDAYLDLGLKFDTQTFVKSLESIINGSIIKVTLTGELKDHTPIEGSDEIVILNNVVKPKISTSTIKNGKIRIAP